MPERNSDSLYSEARTAIAPYSDSPSLPWPRLWPGPDSETSGKNVLSVWTYYPSDCFGLLLYEPRHTTQLHLSNVANLEKIEGH